MTNNENRHLAPMDRATIGTTIKRSLALGWMLTVAVVASAHAAHPLDGRIWDTRSKDFISTEAAYAQAASSRHLLLGERHDSDIHHRLQLEALQEMAKQGRKRLVVMEQFDRENQAALSAAQSAGVADAETLADAGKLDRKGWRWPMYKDLVAFAAGRGWPLAAGNLSRADAREIAMGKRKVALPDIGEAAISALEEDIVNGHCGHRPPQDMLSAIVLAQRARDAAMAEALESGSPPAVLIAGAGHVRRDRAVPRYLKDGRDVLTIAYIETTDGQDRPEDYDAAGYDLLWFTPPTAREDACAKPLGAMGGNKPATAK